MRLFLILFLILTAIPSICQQKYWVYVNEREIGAKTKVADNLERLSCNTHSYSSWLNAFSVSECNIDAIEERFITGIQRVNVYKGNRFRKNESKLGFALDQIEADAVIKSKLTGKNVRIGIIDGGFLEADQDPRLAHLFENDQVKAYRDFVTPDLGPFEGSEHYGDDHGNQVWHMIAGKDPKTEILFGLATGADFYLARTDDGRTDFRAEEDHLIAALEWMDSLQIKLVNISIGYSVGFEDPEENYSPKQMDGKSVALTRAAQIAAEEKGMLLVVAGGNDGNIESFQVVSTPADARDVMAVGATGYKSWQKVKYSSIGAEFLDFVKPDVSCYSSDGTSFSAPIITGLAATVWEKNPNLSNYEIKDLIIKSSHLYQIPNNYLGYGVPNANRLLLIMDSAKYVAGNFKTIRSKRRVKINVDDNKTQRIIIFHKNGKRNVTEQVVERIDNSKLRLDKPANATQSTVVIGDDLYEVIWNN